MLESPSAASASVAAGECVVGGGSGMCPCPCHAGPFGMWVGVGPWASHLLA